VTRQVVFLLEEPSMREFLNGLLPRLAPKMDFILVAHEGKSDLESSLPRKLRAWRTPGARFVVVRDQDSADCHEVKRRLSKIAADAGKPDAIVRIACRELEAWLLGDPSGLARALQRKELLGLETKEKYRDPDRLGSPSKELEEILGSYSKTAGARAAGLEVAWERNSSRSFGHFVKTIRRLAEPTPLP
jgi:hypothetical protein